MIILNKLNNTTVITCETCDAQVTTGMADGVVPSDWMTGQLWLDTTVNEQRQRPICFCPSCKPYVMSTLRLSVSASEEAE